MKTTFDLDFNSYIKLSNSGDTQKMETKKRLSLITYKLVIRKKLGSNYNFGEMSSMFY